MQASHVVLWCCQSPGTHWLESTTYKSSCALPLVIARHGLVLHRPCHSTGLCSLHSQIKKLAHEQRLPWQHRFVVKTVDEAGRKVFINVCGSAKVPAPGGWKPGQVKPWRLPSACNHFLSVWRPVCSDTATLCFSLKPRLSCVWSRVGCPGLKAAWGFFLRTKG